MVGLAGVFAWIIVLAFMIGSWKLQVSTLIKTGLLAGAIYIVFIFMDNSGPVPGWKKLSIAFYRSLTVHGFYLFTAFLAVFVFLSKLKNIPRVFTICPELIYGIYWLLKVWEKQLTSMMLSQ